MAFHRGDLVVFLNSDHERAILGVVQSNLANRNTTSSDDSGAEKKPTEGPESDCSSNSDSESYAPEYPQESEVNVKWFHARKWSPISPTSCSAPTPLCSSSNLKLIHRNIFNGDIVRETASQRVGSIIRRHMRSHALLVGWNAILLNIDCCNLLPVAPFASSYFHSTSRYGEQIGTAEVDIFHVVLRFPDGARIRVEKTSLDYFKMGQDLPEGFCRDDYSEGMFVTGDARRLLLRDSESALNWVFSDSRSSSLFKGEHPETVDFLPFFLKETMKHNSIWLKNLRHRTEIEFLIEEMIPVRVHFSPIRTNSESSENPKPYKIYGLDIKKLTPIHPCGWIYCDIQNVYQYRLRNEDSLYDLNYYKDVEGILYRHLTGQEIACAKLNLSQSGTDRSSRLANLDNKANDEEVELFTSCDLQRVLFRRTRHKFSINQQIRRSKLRSFSSKFKLGDESSSDTSIEEDSNFCELDDTSSTKMDEVALFSDKNTSDHSDSKLNLSSKPPVSEPVINSESLKQIPALTKSSGFPFPPLKVGDIVPIVIVAMVSSYDVLWQDGVAEYNISGENLTPEYLAPDEHSFMPGDIVGLKSETKPFIDEAATPFKDLSTPTNSSFPVDSEHSYGIVLSMNAKEMVCSLQWFKKTASSFDFNVLQPLGSPEEAGVYELVQSYAPSYVIGDLVLASVNDENNIVQQVCGVVDQIDPKTGLYKLLLSDGTYTDVYAVQIIRELVYSFQAEHDALDSSIDPSTSSTFFDAEIYGNEISSDWESSSFKSMDDDEPDTFGPFWKVWLFMLLEIHTHLDDVRAPLNVVTFLFDAFSTHGAASGVEETALGLSKNQTNLLIKERLDLYFTTFSTSAIAIESVFRLVYRDNRDYRLRKLFKLSIQLRRHLQSFADSDDFVNCSCRSQSFHSDLLGDCCSELRTALIARFPNLPISFDALASLEEFIPTVSSWPITLRHTCRYSFLVKLVELLNEIQERFSAWMMENKEAIFNTLQDSDKSELPMKDVVLESIDDNLTDSPLLNAISPNPTYLINKFEDIQAIPSCQRGVLHMENSVHSSHAYYSITPPKPKKLFLSAWRRDNELLSTSLPKGITVKAFEDRMDLFSVMIVGPVGTPYEDSLLFFDFRLTADYPIKPPEVFYHSLSSERINPNLYQEGLVCLSLLGTWKGHHTENWRSEHSNLLQLLVSLQGLILNDSPFFNEAGYDHIRDKSNASELARAYNEGVVANLLQSMVQLIRKPLPIFKTEIKSHFQEKYSRYADRLLFWSSLDDSEFSRLKTEDIPNASSKLLPQFPLAPVSKGFSVSVRRNIEILKRMILEDNLISGLESLYI